MAFAVKMKTAFFRPKTVSRYGEDGKMTKKDKYNHSAEYGTELLIIIKSKAHRSLNL